MEISTTPSTMISTPAPRVGVLRRVWVPRIALAAILLLAAYFRLLSITDWDSGTGQHPDERFFTNVSSSVRLPASVGEYFDAARSPLNPRSYRDFPLFVYGPFPVMITRVVAVSLTPPEAMPELVPAIIGPPVNGETAYGPQIANPERSFPRLWPLISILNPEGRNLTSYGEIVKVGRVLAALFDLGSIVLVFLIGRRLFGLRAGLLAALFSALAVMQIQQSHFFVDPIFSTFFCLLALYWAVRAAQGGGVWVYTALGLSIGLGMANRITLATLGLAAIAATIIAALKYATEWAKATEAPGKGDAVETQHAASAVEPQEHGTTEVLGSHGTESSEDVEVPAGKFVEEVEPQPQPDRFVQLLSLFADRFLTRGLPLLVLAGLLTLLSYRTFQPDAFTGSRPDSPTVPGERPLDINALAGFGFFDIRPDPRFIANLGTVQQLVSGETDFPPGQQWVDRPAYTFPWVNMVVWGMGPALGLAAWLGMLGFAVLDLRSRIIAWRRGEPPPSLQAFAAWVLIIWVLFYFAWQGRQFAITMRYLLPIYGPLIVFAAWSVLGIRNWGLGIRPRRLLGVVRWFSLAALPIVLVLTAGWAYAFSRIYTQPHSRVIAAEWLLAQVPPGSGVTAEIWDDPLPLQVAGYPTWGVLYNGIETAPYAEDDFSKYIGTTGQDGQFRAGLIDQLDEADYVTLTSNRIYGSTERLPARYPALRNYYHYLFNGELGFKLVADITSYPNILGIRIPDQSAEEAFTVYDHPRVLIFQKTAAYSRENAERLITGDVIWGEVYKNPISIADRNNVALRITASEWPNYRAHGTYSEMFTQSPWYGAVAPFVWLLIVEMLGLAVFALLFRLFPALPDRGYSLAKILGLLLVAYPAWLLGSLKIAPFSPQTVWICALPLIGAGVLAIILGREQLLAFWQRRRIVILSAEGIFLGFFLLGILLRWFNPDLWHPARGGEKPMDLAYLNAVLKSAQFPPYDPWHAGGYINYYYFGFVLVGTLIHLTTVEPTIGYNLAVATLFGLTALGAWGVVYNLLSRRQEAVLGTVERRALLSAGLAPVFMLLLGNLAQAIWFLNGYAAEQTGRPEWAFWDATRIVQGTVNEFPFFTFLFADLHAHMIVMPLSLALLGLALVWVRRGAGGRRQEAGGREQRAFVGAMISLLPAGCLLVLAALLVGAIRVTNTWDYPTYVGILAVTLGLVAWQRVRAEQAKLQGVLRHFSLFVLHFACIALLGNLLFVPLTAAFATESSGAELLRDGSQVSLIDQVLGVERTAAGDLLRMYGLWLFLALSGGLVLARRYLGLSRVFLVGLGAGYLLFTAFAVWRGWAAPTLLVPLLFGAGWLAWEMRNQQVRKLLPLLWGGTALALCLLVDLVVVKGDVGRLNTVFKFGIHSWTLFALSAAVAVPWLLFNKRQPVVQAKDTWWHAGGSWVWRGAVALLFLAALVYPLTATPARIADRWKPDAPRTLDGAAFFTSVNAAQDGAAYSLDEDAAAIKWLQTNVSGTPVIVEAHQPSYQWAGRVATYTGLPTLLGWEWHQVQQRTAVAAGPVISHRQNVIREIYGSPDADNALKLLRQYGVEYVYLGGVERSLFDYASLAKFDFMAQRGDLQEVFNLGQTRIYQVAEPGKPAMLTSDKPLDTPTTKTIPPLMLTEPVSELPSAGTYAWNSLTGASSLPATLTWLLFSYGLALLGVPLAVLLFGGWRDGGWVWARLLGLLLWAYATWLPTSLGFWRYDGWGVAGGLIVVLLLNIGLLVWMGRREAGGRRQEAGVATTDDRRPTTDDPEVRSGFGVEEEESERRTGFSAWFGAGFSSVALRLRERWRGIVVGEAIFLAGFAFLLAIRAFNPDLWHPTWGGEKPMEFGFLNAILRSPVMPPYDPFYSDGYINYYYYGLYLVSLPIKATGIDPALGFNLAVAFLFGLLLTGAFSIVVQATGRIRYGLIGALAVGVLGNLAGYFTVGWSQGFEAITRALVNGGPGGFAAQLGDWYIGPSRVIPFTINEFPFWSFLFADLHPHMIGLPITLLVVALGLRLQSTVSSQQSAVSSQQSAVSSQQSAVSSQQSTVSSQQEVGDEKFIPVVCYVVLALALGTLAVTNSWDFPTYGLLTGLALMGAAWRAGKGFAWLAVARAAGIALLIGLGGLVLYLPFFDRYAAPVGGIGIVRPEATLARDYAVIYGLFLAVLLPFLVGGVWRTLVYLGRWRTLRNPLFAWAIGGAALFFLIGVALLPLLGLRLALMALILLGGLLLVQRQSSAGLWYATLLTTIGAMVSLGVELVYVRDHLDGGDWYRMNSVFKFGQQVWVLFALAAAIALPAFLRGLRRVGGVPADYLGRVALTGLALLAVVFPLAGVPSRIGNRFDVDTGLTLDGLAFMEQASFDYDCSAFGGCEPGATRVAVDLSGDAEAVDWLNREVEGTPIVLQSNLWFYRAYGIRIAANTGLPTVISSLHANEQRDGAFTAKRDSDVEQFFRSADVETALRVLAKYDVDYLYVGGVERAFYPSGLSKFDSMRGTYLEPVYDTPKVQIYKVVNVPTQYASPLPVEFSPSPVRPQPQPVVEPADLEPVVGEVPADMPELEAANKANPTDGPTAFGLAERYRAIGRLNDAAAVLAVAAQANPGDIGVHHLWGDILAEAGRYDEAEQALLLAAQADPSAGNWYKLAAGLFKWGKYDKAEIALTQVLSIDPNIAEAHYTLGEIYGQRGDSEAAITAYERYLELAPNGPFANDARAKISELR
jgi:YYY domain-containing protein